MIGLILNIIYLKAMEKTYVMIKPDGVQRGLIGRIIQKFEDKGLQLVGLKMTMTTDEILQEHYAELADRPFFPDLMAYISSGPVVCMCWQGQEAVKVARSIIGATNPLNAAMGTIRGDFGQVPGRNLIHGADSGPSASREIAIWFADSELVEWEPALGSWIHDH